MYYFISICRQLEFGGVGLRFWSMFVSRLSILMEWFDLFKKKNSSPRQTHRTI